MKVFSSGSCRLLISMGDGRNKIEPIHSLFYNFVGVNFLGKLHNSKQHIQFIKYILGEISIPSNILPAFFRGNPWFPLTPSCPSGNSNFLLFSIIRFLDEKLL